MFNDNQKKLLTYNLDGNRVKTRQQGNITLSYLEGYDLIDTANYIFGFGGWSYEVKELQQVSDETNQNQNIVIGYRARVSVTVYGTQRTNSVIREDVGFGTGIAREYAAAHESGAKEAVTDALKRALRSFGNQFGNALYDKSQKNVDKPNTSRSQIPAQTTSQLSQSASLAPNPASDPYASLYALGLGIQEVNGEILVTGQTYGKQQHIKPLGFRWDAGRKLWYKAIVQQEAA